MPQIIVAADRGAAFGEGAVTFRETVNVADFESQHFASQLVERIGWAVEDADQVERHPNAPAETTKAPNSYPEAPEPQAAERDESEEPQAERDEWVTVPSPA